MPGNKIEFFALLLGGDLGETEKFFAAALAGLLAGGADRLHRSRLYRTAPVDCVPGTPDFLNCAVTGAFPGTPRELLAVTQRLEIEAGRPARHSSREARVLDIDIILFGSEVLHTPELTIPHPRARQRRFVLEPLAEIAPSLRFPDTGETVADALARLDAVRPQP